MSKAKSASRASACLAAARLLDHEAAVGQALGDRRAQRLLVVDEQQMSWFQPLAGAGILTPGANTVNAGDGCLSL